MKNRIEAFFRDNPTEWSFKDVAKKLGVCLATARKHTLSLVKDGTLVQTGIFERRKMFMIRD